MSKNRIVVIKIFIVLLLFLFLYGVGYLFEVMRYPDNDLVYVTLLEEENRSLRNSLNEINKFPEEMIITKVLYRDIYHFSREIIIDNSKKNIELNDLVLSKDGLIGVVREINQSRAYVQLISKDYHVSVKINDTYGDLYNGIVELVDRYADIKEGDKVYTSGIGYLKGDIYLGYVKEIIKNENVSGVSLKVELVNHKNISYVGVIR